MNYVRDHYGFERPDGNVSATLTNRSAWQRALFKFGWNYLGRKDAYPKEPIWVPSSSDSQSAFQQYLDEIRARGAATDENVKVEGGRVSVQGVQHVMAINGILTKWIFDRNKAKHSFYVEESYIIPWMYPHLTPYGIILKINKDPVPSPEENPGFWQEIIQRDRQYWDALVDELKKDNRFRRDDVAQKSFAKLRAAIGGVYAFRRLYAEAEYAYRQSISLCPDTPEGNFRLAQMYVEMGNASDDISRFDMGLEVMTVYGKRDPYNAKIREAIAALRDIRTLAVSQGELEQQRAKQPDDLSTATRLVFVYARRMRTREMDQLVDSLMQRPDFAADQFRQVTQLYIQMSRIDRAADVLKVFTRRYPDNPSGWLDLAIAQIGLNRCDEAAVAVERALALDKSGQLRNFVMQDRRFQPCRNNPRFRVLLGQQPGRLLPGGVIVTP
jgi:tetratricopeptide (TPR) repeat protein